MTRATLCRLLCAVALVLGADVARAAVRVEVKSGWIDAAGRCVLAPLSCPGNTNCIKIENKFLEQVQTFLAVDGPETLRSAFFDRSIEMPTDEEVLAIAAELGYDSVILAGSIQSTSYTEGYGPPDSDTGLMTKTTYSNISGSTRLLVKTVDGVILVDGSASKATSLSFTGGSLMRRQLLNILEQAKQRQGN